MGIHIRRGDMATHKKGYRRCVPLEEYEKTIMQYPDEFFYVATDEPELFNSLRLKFGDRVFRKNINSFSRDSKDISDAFVEILILANSTSLFGGKSAFVSLASFIGNLPLYQYKGYVPLKNSVKL